MRATCHDWHIPRDYPELLWYKAAAGTKDVIDEIRGVISTFARERRRMAAEVWAAKQQEMVRPIHTPVLDGRATCIDCHKGVAHERP